MTASNGTMPMAATSVLLGAAAATSKSPAIRLLHTLVATFSAIFLGFVTVRLQLVVPGRGDMAAMGFYTGKIALPLLIFKTVATTGLGSVDPGTIAACTLGKLLVMMCTLIATFFAYNAKHGPSRGQRILTAGIFSYFVVASNDFALGLPVVQALYGKQADMAAYVSANALVGAVFFTPVASILFAIGGAGKNEKEGGDEEEAQEVAERSRWSVRCTGCLATAVDILSSPVITSTLLGALYKLALGKTLVLNGDKIDFPSPLSEVLTLFTSPFGMSALFLTGTSLRSARLTLWPFFLVLMKVLACAYASFLFGGLLVGNVTPSSLKATLQNFTFFYGSVPTSSAPLLFAAQYDPGAVELIATAILFGLVLAGPIMFTTALFLEGDGVNMISVLREVQLTASLASVVAMLILAALMLCLGCDWGFRRCAGKQILAVYSLVVLVYEITMTVFNPEVDDQLCMKYGANRFFPPAVGIAWMQSTARFLLLGLQALLVTVWTTERSSPSWAGLAVIVTCLILGAVPAFLVYPNTLNEVCSGFMGGVTLKHGVLLNNFIYSCVLLVGVVALAAVGLCRARRAPHVRPRAEAVSSSGSDSSESTTGDAGNDGALGFVGADDEHAGDWASSHPRNVARTLGILLALRVLTQVVNTVEVISSRLVRGSFTQMLVLENLMEHGQGALLLVALFFDHKFVAAVSLKLPKILEVMRGCCRRSAIRINDLEIEAPPLPDAQAEGTQPMALRPRTQLHGIMGRHASSEF